MKVTINKKTIGKIEQLELLISILCFLDDKKLSKTNIKVLAYYVVYGLTDKTDKMLIDGKVVKDLSQIRNVKVILNKLGFLKRTEGLYRSYELNISKNFNLKDNEIQLLIKIDNS